MTETPFLEARDLSVEFTTRSGAYARALDGVHVAVRRGEILAIVGESGSGKTTLARTLIGLQAPTSGEVLLEGAPLKYSMKGLRALRRRVQMVLQDAGRARSTRARPSTSRSPRASGCTGWSAATPSSAQRPSWSRPRCPRPGCVRPNGCSCDTRTSSPAGRSNAC